MTSLAQLEIVQISKLDGILTVTKENVFHLCTVAVKETRTTLSTKRNVNLCANGKVSSSNLSYMDRLLNRAQQ